MDLNGYSTNNPTPASCGDYQLSGQYTADSYIAKTYTGLGTNHYQVVVRFGVGYIGSWDPTDQLYVDLDGDQHTLNYNYGVVSDVCSGSDIDSLKIVSFEIEHNASSLSINVTSSILETDPDVKYWGLKDMLIGVKQCHSSCDTCTGPTHAECLSCSTGFYLSGNTCVVNCDQYFLPSRRVCLDNCPIGYYSTASKACQSCRSGCLMCEDGHTCSIEDG